MLEETKDYIVRSMTEEEVIELYKVMEKQNHNALDWIINHNTLNIDMLTKIKLIKDESYKS